MIPWFEWKIISFGFVTLQVWGLFVACGILLSVWILVKRSAVRLSLSHNVLLDLVLWCVLGGFLGARLVHVFGYEWQYYAKQPLEILTIWQGGFSSFGGFAGAALAGYWFVRRIPNFVRRLSLLDEVLFSAVYGWMVGRVGCAMVHDHWGVPCNCPLAVATSQGGRLDMAVLEILALVPLAVWLFVTRKVERSYGVLSAVILFYYALVRFALDFFRAYDIVNADIRYWHLTPAQYCAILLCFCAIIIFFYSKKSKSI